MSMLAITLVGIGGAFGALLRYGAGQWTVKTGVRAIYGTLGVNLAGSLALGILIGLQLQRTNPDLYLFVATGFLGGLTTYSTLNVQKVLLTAEGARRTLAAYLGLTYAGGWALTGAGIWLGHAVMAT